MTVRQITLADVDKIDCLQSRFFPDGWSKCGLIDGINIGNLKGVVCYEDNTLIAFATYSSTVDFAELLDILVEPSFRQKGVASKMLNCILEEIQGQSPKMFLEVREGNAPAVNFYKKLGFTTISIRKKYYPDGENALVMEKELI